MQTNPHSQDQKLSSKEENREKLLDAQIQFLVLLQIIIEKTEYMETQGYIYGNLKQFLKTSKGKFEDFIRRVFREQKAMDSDDAVHVTGRLMVIQERVENALENRFVITVDDRKERMESILSQYMIKPMVERAMKDMEEKNLFNF